MSAKKSREILRYWSALLKYQEALSARPRARRLEQGEPRLPNLQQPSSGREYVKLPLEGEAAFLVGKGRFEPLPLDAETLAAIAAEDPWPNDTALASTQGTPGGA